MTDMGLMGQVVCDASNSETQFTHTTPPHPGLDGGFCSIRSLAMACRRRVAPLLVQFPPFAGGVVAVRGGVAPTVQTTSATNANNGVLLARWSAVRAQRRLASCVARTRTCYCLRRPALSHVNPLFRVWAGLPTLVLASPRAQ